jgi:lysophospholipase L1-like esterase
MKLLTSLISLSRIALLLAVGGISAVLPLQIARAAEVITVEGSSRVIKGTAYEAKVDRLGALPSIKVEGQEFFKSTAGIPHGAYLYQEGPVWLEEIEQPKPNTVVAKSSRAIARYEFSDDSITVTIENISEKPMTYYMVFDPAVDTLINSQGQASKTYVNQGGQQSTTWFAGKNKLKVEGAGALAGPWGGEKLQLWLTTLQPKATRVFTLSPGQATPEELTKIATLATKPNVPQRADVASPKIGNDGNIRPDFLRTHQQYLQRIKEGPIGLLFIGDSITNRWRTVDKLWQERYGQYQPANFGIEGDQTQHVLWRFDNGELDGIRPKVVVVMIGTNNMGFPAEEIVKGNKQVVAEIHRRLPDTKVLLLGIFPRGAQATDPVRAKIRGINAELARLDDGNKTRFLDISSKLLAADGNLSPEVAPDALHLSPQGYQLWADAMQPLLDSMMK